VVIYNGVDLPEAARARESAGPREPSKLVCVGRFITLKGQHVAIRAMRPLADRFPQAKLVLLGSGPQEGSLRRLTRDLDLNGKVRFPGWLPHERVLREAATAAAVVVPSTGEGFGLAVAEAMACGTPLVTSRIGVFRELLGSDERAGLMFPVNDPDALAEAVGRVFKRPAEATRRASCAYERVCSRFSVQRMVNDYLRLYDGLAARRNGRARRATGRVAR